MAESLLVIGVFVILYGVLHPLFKVCVEAVCLWSIAVTWLFLVPFDPIYWTCAVGSLLAGAFLGYRVMPAQVMAGLGFPPWIASNHIQFDQIAKRIGSGRLRDSEMAPGFMNMELEHSMHIGTLRMYNRSVFWAICVTFGHVFFYQIMPGFIACIQIALTSFPIGFVFKRWLARRFSAMQ
jgi:hypothetical protein